MTAVHSGDNEKSKLEKRVVHAGQGRAALTGHSIPHSSPVEEPA